MDARARRPLRPGPAVFEAVGCRIDDPLVLLLRGDDGRFYAQALPDGDPVPVDRDPGEGWATDRLPPPTPVGPRPAE